MPKFIFTKNKECYSPEEQKIFAGFLAERLYGTFAILVLNIGLFMEVAHISPFEAMLAVAGTVLGLLLASIFSEELSHRVVHGRIMNRKEFRRMTVSHIGLIIAGIPALVASFAAFLGVFSLKIALLIDIILAFVTILFYIFRAISPLGHSKIMSLVLAVIQIFVAAIILIVEILSH